MALTIFRRRGETTIGALYGAIVAQARQPVFYADWGVPDTLEGRFEMIVLHLALVIRRLRHESAEARKAAQDLFDAFCTDMDRSLREMGVSDTGVPRQMRRMGEAFYGRAAAYERGLDAADQGPLTSAVQRNVFAAEEKNDGAAAISLYMRRVERELARQPVDGLLKGELRLQDLLPSETALPSA